MSQGTSPTRMYVALCEKEAGLGYEPISFYLPEEPMFSNNTADTATWYFKHRLDFKREVALCLTLEDWNSKHAWAVKSVPSVKKTEEVDDAEYEYVFRTSYDTEMEPRVDGFHVDLSEIHEGNRKAEWYGKKIGKTMDYYKIVQDDEEEVVTIYYHYKDRPKTDSRSDTGYSKNLGNVKFETRRDAISVLEALLESIRYYGIVKVADFNDACGLDSQLIDFDFGWYDISTAVVRCTSTSKSTEYWIDFPKPIRVKIEPKKG